MTFTSNAKERYIEFRNYYKRHPFKFIKLVEEMSGIRLNPYQKVLLFLPTKEMLRQKKTERLLRKFQNKR